VLPRVIQFARKDLADNGGWIGIHGMTEPHTGSEAFSIFSRAERNRARSGNSLPR
jgi:hypothetical protein